jgi:hypothetical protein
VHGVRHERAHTWNVERWATTALSRDPAATRVTAVTADLCRIITFTPFRLSTPSTNYTGTEALPPSPDYPSRSPPSSNMVDYQHSALPALSTISRPSLAHLRVPILTIREHGRLPALSTTSTLYVPIAVLTTHLDHLPLRTWSTTSTQHYQHSLPSLAHLRVPILTIREHDRLRSTQHYQHQLSLPGG